MKLDLLLSVFVLLFFSYNTPDINDKSKRNEHWAWWLDAKSGKGQWIKVEDRTTVDKGNYSLFYFNGNIRETGKLDKGKNVDTIFGYNINGQLDSYKIRDSSWYFVKDGPLKLYSPNGKIRGDGIIQNHTYGKKWIQYYENGNLHIVNDSLGETEWSANYFESGSLEDSIFRIKGYIYSIKSWYENGQLKESYEYEDSDLNGIGKTYYENGQIQDSGRLLNGKWEGVTFEWFETGQLKALDNYKHGKLDGINFTYHKNGKIKTVGNIKDGIPSGEIKQYDESGKLFSNDFYKDGVKINK